MKYFIIIIMFLLWLLACSEEKKKKEVPKFYSLPLKIGNEYQLALQNDSTVFVNSIIVDTVFRSDGQKLYKKISEHPGLTIVSYLYHKDGYLIGSFIDTLLNSSDSSVYIPGNPFCECRIARVHPYDGEIWDHIMEDNRPLNCYVKAARIKKIDTHLGEFKDVFSYTLRHKKTDEILMSVFYSNKQGHVGTFFYYNYPKLDTIVYVVSYIKIDGKEYGEKIVLDADSLTKKALPGTRLYEDGYFYPYGILGGMKLPEKEVFMKKRQ